MATAETSPGRGEELHEAAPKPQEIERKFIVPTLPENLQDFPQTFIRQGYLSISEDQEKRIRQAGDQYFRTKKSGRGLSRSEDEVEISPEEFERDWGKTAGKRLEKIRYKLPFEDDDNLTIELNIYQGDLQDMPPVAEVEFDDEEEAGAFTPPLWFGREVTDNPAYRNSALATKGMPKEDEGKEEQVRSEGVVIERSLQKDIDQLVEMIIEKKKDVDRPLIVGLGGRTSAGKSTVVSPVEERARALGLSVTSLPMDDYSLGNAHIARLAEQGIDINWDHPLYMDFALLREHIDALKRGETIDKPTFSFITGERDENEHFDPADIIIVEGLFALRPELQDTEDVKAFIDISLHGSIVRRLLRDVQRTTMDPAQILRYYVETVEPMYQEHIAATKENADMVLVNEYNPRNEAGRAGMYEAQTKFRTKVDSETLRRAGAELLGVVKQEDLYLSPRNRTLEESDESFRIRREGGVSVLSYKGPRIGETVRVRPKFEFEIDEATEKVFTDTYGDTIREIDKVRKLYRLGNAIVSLDQVTKQIGTEFSPLGTFIEVRCDPATCEEQMRIVCEKLGLDPEQKINTSYAAM